MYIDRYLTVYKNMDHAILSLSLLHLAKRNINNQDYI